MPARCFACLSLLGLLTACGEPTATADPRACQQSGEFGNTGCFEVDGEVVGMRGQPLSGISVVTRTLPGLRLFTGSAQFTDAAGRFRLRSARIFGPPLVGSAPDTVTVYVVAADPRSAGVGITATILDSVRTLLTVAPVGSIPETTPLRITLPVP